MGAHWLVDCLRDLRDLHGGLRRCVLLLRLALADAHCVAEQFSDKRSWRAKFYVAGAYGAYISAKGIRAMATPGSCVPDRTANTVANE